MKIKLSDYIARFLVDIGVKHVFMVPGGGAMHLNDSFGHQAGLALISNQHEQASAMAAETYARIADNALGVALVTTGPGGTNAVTGVAGAWLDSTPCLFISGQVKRSDLIGDLGVRQNGVQEIGIVAIVESITKYAVTIMDPNTIRYHLEKAVYLAKSGRPGPVWLDVPLDIQAAIIETDSIPGFDQPGMVETPSKTDLVSAVTNIIDLLNASERPVLLIGNGVRLSKAIKEVLSLVERLQIPVLLTWPAMDMLPDNHALLVGRPGPVAPRGANFALQNSDLLISLGARLDTVVTGYSHKNFARGAKKIMVDIDQAEINKIQTPIDVPVCADAKIVILEMLRQSSRLVPKERKFWQEKCQEWKKKYPVMLSEYRQEKLVSAYLFTETLSDELNGDDVIIPTSSGAGIEIFLLAFRPKKGQRVLNTTALGAMGNGLPASIGACLARGGKRTICIDADGGIQFNIQEFATIARNKLPIKVFVLNNQGYSSIRTSQLRYFNRLTGADNSSGLELPDICKIAEAYGLPTRRITESKGLADKIKEVLDLPGMMVCEVLNPPDEPRAPSMMSVQKAGGGMISKPLEDLWPFLDRQEFLSNMIIPPIEE